MAQDEYKQCPYCAEEIRAAAIKCKHCGSALDHKEPSSEHQSVPLRQASTPPRAHVPPPSSATTGASNGKAVASLVLGIVGLLASIYLLFGSFANLSAVYVCLAFAVILNMLAISYAARGIKRAKFVGGNGKHLAVAGLVLGIIGIVPSGFILAQDVGVRAGGASPDDGKVRNAHTIAVQFTTAYERWSIDHDAPCPGSITELIKYMSNKSDAEDPWGNDYTMLCGNSAPSEAEGFGIVSRGPDGRLDTDDDIHSWKRLSAR